TTTERGSGTGTFTYGTPPTSITSASTTTFTVQSAGTFGVTTDGGDPKPLLSVSGTLPSGVTFADNGLGDGTGTLAGTPAFGTVGTYPLTIKASNQVPTDATQSFTLTVNGASSTTVLATPAPSPSVVGQSVAFSATVPANAAGTVTFDYGDGGQDIVNVASGGASHNHTYAAPGNYTVNAVFSGDSSYAGSTSFN